MPQENRFFATCLDTPIATVSFNGASTADLTAVTTFSAFRCSSVGRKMIVAITGVVLILFVTGHLVGNLQIFLGPAWINGYAEHLRELGPLLWIIRGVLFIVVLLHIYYTTRLAIENRRARPERYKRKDNVKATLASRSMVMSGLILVAFIIYHLLHFSVRTTDPRFAALPKDPLGHYDVYSMMILGFSSPLVSGFYIVAMFLLCLHLSHGSSSFFQSLGLNNKKLAPRLAFAGRIFAWILFAGYSSIPAAVLLGWVKLHIRT
jgi:succinate dehydrogenase / fumarate reductase, cytochrome b subunit